MDAGSRRFAWLRRKRALKLAEARKPRKNRSGTFSAVTLGAGAIATLLALFGIGPFAVQALVVNLGQGGSTPIAASAFFPPPSPQQKIMNVYDPPRSGGGDDATPTSSSSPGATLQPTPSPSHRPDE